MTTELNLNSLTMTPSDDSDNQAETSSELSMNESTEKFSEQQKEDKSSALLYKTESAICKSCVISKQIRIVHHKFMRSTTCLLEQIHSDL